jgi:HSP20 family protein
VPDWWRRWFDAGSEGGGWLRIEEFQEPEALVVRAELPGIDPDRDVTLEVVDDRLRLSATREERSEDNQKDGYRSEFHYGRFVREFPLPRGVDPEAVTATYRDGILEIRVPRPPEPSSAPTRVPVSRASG